MGTTRRIALLGCSLLLITVVAGRATEPEHRSELFVAGTKESTASAAPTAAAESHGHRFPAPATPRPSGLGVRFSFDAGLAGGVRDVGGRLSLAPRTAAGGALGTAPHGSGLAVRFPRPCAHYGSGKCKRAILESGPADFLNPGNAAFRYGATVRLAHDETSKGANVLQKGYSVRGSQFKLQVDGSAGQPSCVLVGTASAQIYVALAKQTVADGQWHSVECARRDALLMILVDGAILGQVPIPSALSIVNTDRLCVGGKGTSPNNDQFTGVIDDIFITLDA